MDADHLQIDDEGGKPGSTQQTAAIVQNQSSSAKKKGAFLITCVRDNEPEEQADDSDTKQVTELQAEAKKEVSTHSRRESNDTNTGVVSRANGETPAGHEHPEANAPHMDESEDTQAANMQNSSVTEESGEAERSTEAQASKQSRFRVVKVTANTQTASTPHLASGVASQQLVNPNLNKKMSVPVAPTQAAYQVGRWNVTDSSTDGDMQHGNTLPVPLADRDRDLYQPAPPVQSAIPQNSLAPPPAAYQQTGASAPSTLKTPAPPSSLFPQPPGPSQPTMVSPPSINPPPQFPASTPQFPQQPGVLYQQSPATNQPPLSAAQIPRGPVPSNPPKQPAVATQAQSQMQTTQSQPAQPVLLTGQMQAQVQAHIPVANVAINVQQQMPKPSAQPTMAPVAQPTMLGNVQQPNSVLAAKPPVQPNQTQPAAPLAQPQYVAAPQPAAQFINVSQQYNAPAGYVAQPPNSLSVRPPQMQPAVASVPVAPIVTPSAPLAPSPEPEVITFEHRIDRAFEDFKKELMKLVNDELVELHNEIADLRETRYQLDHENVILRRHATQETLKAVDQIRREHNAHLHAAPAPAVSGAYLMGQQPNVNQATSTHNNNHPG